MQKPTVSCLIFMCFLDVCVEIQIGMFFLGLFVAISLDLWSFFILCACSVEMYVMGWEYYGILYLVLLQVVLVAMELHCKLAMS